MKYQSIYILSLFLFILFILHKKNKIKQPIKYTYHDENFNKINYNQIFYDSQNKIYTSRYMSPTEYPNKLQ